MKLQKICTICKIKKPLNDFYKKGKYYRSECKKCSIKKRLEYYFKNKKPRYCKCGEELEHHKKICSTCLNHSIEKNKKNILDYYFKNKKRISEYKKQWYETTKNKTRISN
jgi:hypothetical protein